MLGTLSFLTLLTVISAGVVLSALTTSYKGLRDEVLSALADDTAEIFVEDYFTYRKTGVETPALRKISSELAKMHSKKDIFMKEPSELLGADSFFLCTTCRATAKIAINLIRDEDGELNGPDGDDNARLLALDFCRRFEFHTDEVCLGVFENTWPLIKYIAQESNMDSRTFCSLFLGINFCSSTRNPEYNFTLSIDPTGLPISGPKDYIPQSSANNVAVLHLSDFHYDPQYEPGLLAGCDEPLCCRRDRDIAVATGQEAGYWGDYRDCDAPWHLIENALEHIKETHRSIDYIYQTGDIVDHYVWGTTKERNIEVITKVNKKLAEMFPDIPVYPCIGNHEPQPVNAFSPENAPAELSTRWLYESLYDSWSKWLPESTKDTILKGGYYTVTPKNGFRIIALNNNDCYNMNWWLFYNGQNKIPQLQWLHDTLLAAEKSNEHVHILTHIPTGGESCWSVWSREFNRIVVRFNKIVSGIFNGHTHKDQMAVHYSSNGHAVGVVWNGGSITPASNKNPNYRFYQLDSSTMEVAESETWIFNLTLANLHGADRSPEWYKMYDFRNEFTNDLSPNGIDKLLDQFAEDPSLLRKYWEYLSTMADPRLEKGCDSNCLLDEICHIATTVSNEKTRCLALQQKLTLGLDETASTSSVTTTTSTTTTAIVPDNGGAASMAALSLSMIMASIICIKFIF